MPVTKQGLPSPPAAGDIPVQRPALRYHGAKFRLAPWILSHFPDHQCYVEPFGGAAGVLLQKRRSYAEVYNDLDGDVVNFFRVLRDPEQRRSLQEQLTLTPYAREEFDLAWTPSDDAVERARRICMRAQMGFGSAGATKGTTGFRIDTKRLYSTAQQLWMEYPARLAAVGARLSGVLIENRPALKVMATYDSPTTLHFVDPPYMHATRVLQSPGGRGYYQHEMTDNDHSELLAALCDLKGMVIVTGYETALYDEALHGWRTEKTKSRISGGRGSAVRTEKLWMNQACSAALAHHNRTLFPDARSQAHWDEAA